MFRRGLSPLLRHVTRQLEFNNSLSYSMAGRLPSSNSGSVLGRRLSQSSLAIAWIRRMSSSQARYFSTDSKANGNIQTRTQAESPPRRRPRDDLKEYQERAATGSTATFDAGLISPEDASIFPRIKTTSLSTKRIVIHDEALMSSVTLVLVAFRSFADDQLQSWKRAFEDELPRDKSKWFDVTINESFGAQALSGFIQRLHRGRTDPSLHDYYVAFNSRAREPLESLLPSRNRMFGHVLLLDRHARVRFRASGMASDDALQVFLSCAKKLVQEGRPSQLRQR